MMRVIECATESASDVLRGRRRIRDADLEGVVAAIVDDVRHRGDAALLEQARRFDSSNLDSIELSAKEWDQAQLSADQEEVIRRAWNRILEFHERQFEIFATALKGPPGDLRWTVDDQTMLGQRVIPLNSVGLYVPGGGAAYPSSVLMLGGPARAAHVQKLSMTSPVRKDGTLHPAVLIAARRAGIEKLFKVGGASAIAALAYGTESVPRVDKIVGPGNRFVNEAKRQVWGSVGLDGYAGPSEVCVLVDEAANTRYAVADLLTQIEHAPDNAAFLITLSRAKLDELLAEISTQLEAAPRADIMRTALKNESLAFVARDVSEACELVNEIAPEHVTLALQDPEAALPLIRNASCILMGESTPESVADYCLGPSHTLPTSGAARFESPVSVLDFLKLQSVGQLTAEQLAPLIDIAEAFGKLEGLPGHGFGATVRRAEQRT